MEFYSPDMDICLKRVNFILVLKLELTNPQRKNYKKKKWEFTHSITVFANTSTVSFSWLH
jgi:hypothetical protein